MCERTESLNAEIPDSILLKYAILDLKKARVEIGKLEAYIEELKHEIKSLKKKYENCVFHSHNAE